MQAGLGNQGKLSPFTDHDVTEVWGISFIWRVETKCPHFGAFKQPC